MEVFRWDSGFIFLGYNGDRKGLSKVDLGKGLGGLIRRVECWFNCKVKECIEENGCIFKVVNVKMIEVCLKYELKVVC